MVLCVEAAAESLRVLHCQRQIVTVSALVVHFVIVAVAGEASEKLRAAAFRAAPSIHRQNSIAAVPLLERGGSEQRLPFGSVNAQ